MSSKVVSSDSTHRDFHPSLYEGNHQDYYLPDLPILMPLAFTTVLNASSWGDPITSPKVFYPLLGVYWTLKFTHFCKGLEGT